MTSSTPGLTGREWRAILSLGSVFFLRMLGLFLVLPVLSPYASELPGTSPLLIGLAVGAFPLSQTLLQVPFGWASDRLGRRPVIVAGLVLFAMGALMAAWATTIWTLIGGLFLQGSGAIASVLIALLADLTRSGSRTRAMAGVGGSVGLALGLGLVGGPLVASAWGVPLIFELMAGLTVGAIAVVLLAVPVPERESHREEVQLSTDRVGTVARNGALWRLNGGIFLLNGTLRALFVVLPFLLYRTVSPERVWLVYLGVVGISGVVMFPTVFLAERRGYLPQVALASVAVLVAGLVGMVWVPGGLWLVLLALGGYFVGFSLLEALLPSAVTRSVPRSDRGTAVGLFNMSQYLGAFAGSLLGGLFLEEVAGATTPRGTGVLFGLMASVMVLWSLCLEGGAVFETSVEPTGRSGVDRL